MLAHIGSVWPREVALSALMDRTKVYVPGILEEKLEEAERAGLIFVRETRLGANRYSARRALVERLGRRYGL